MPEDYRSSSGSYDKESRVFREPVRIVDDIIELTDEVRFQNTSLNSSTATLVSWPDECEVVWLRHVDATQIVWLGATSGITAGGAGTFPMRPEDPPIRVRVKEGTALYAITSSANVDLHTMGYRKL